MSQRYFVQTWDTGLVKPGVEIRLAQRFGDHEVRFTECGWWATCPFLWSGLYLPWIGPPGKDNWIERVTIGGLPFWGSTGPFERVSIPWLDFPRMGDYAVVFKNASHVDEGRLILALYGMESLDTDGRSR